MKQRAKVSTVTIFWLSDTPVDLNALMLLLSSIGDDKTGKILEKPFSNVDAL